MHVMGQILSRIANSLAIFQWIGHTVQIGRYFHLHNCILMKLFDEVFDENQIGQRQRKIVGDKFFNENA